MISQFVVILFILAAVALVWWGINRMAVPEPIKTVVLVVLGLIVLYYLYTILVGGHALAFH
jgi:hypothetical protein